MEELKTKYQIPKPIGLDWVKKQELLLLLDGLDEVKAEHRNSCVAALNNFQKKYAAGMVVCSRIKDYENLSSRLRFQSAIYLRSLTPEQICQYLDNIQANFTGLKALIEGDTALQELAKSPLMLSIMVLAYEGVTAEDLPNTDVVEERRKQLFDAYITRMFHRPTRLKVEQRYSETQSIRWLTWLAQRMVQESQSVFLIERMQPTWLPTNYTKYQKILYRLAVFLIVALSYALIYGLSYALIYALTDGVIYALTLGLTNGLSLGLDFGLFFGLISAFDNPEIKTVETLKWSWKEAKNSLIRAGNLGLIGGMKGSAIATETIPNQGIYRTAMNAGIMGLMVGLFFELFFGPLTGLFCGLIAVIFGGGKACIQHLTLRLILYAHGCIPWNYARFLDYAADRIFLQKVGGGYIFIHRLLLEHFAQMKLGR